MLLKIILFLFVIQVLRERVNGLVSCSLTVLFYFPSYGNKVQ
jgi:hypothetical protein